MTRKSGPRWRLDLDALRYAAARAGCPPGDRRRPNALAALSGVPAATVRSYFNGLSANPSASYLIQLADALEVDPHDLMIETEDE